MQCSCSCLSHNTCTRTHAYTSTFKVYADSELKKTIRNGVHCPHRATGKRGSPSSSHSPLVAPHHYSLHLGMHHIPRLSIACRAEFNRNNLLTNSRQHSKHSHKRIVCSSQRNTSSNFTGANMHQQGVI